MPDSQEPTTSPLDGLPPARRVTLRSAKIELAAVEVRYAAEGEALTADQGLTLRNRFPEVLDLLRLEAAEEHQLQLAVEPGGPISGQAASRSRGWQFLTPANDLIVTVLPDKFSIQTPRYVRWRDSLLEPLRLLLPVIEEVVRPRVVQRVGLRYINRLTDETASSVGAWKGRLRPEILGPLHHHEFGPRLKQAQQQFELTLGREAGAIVRHGAYFDVAARSAVSYLIDIDVFDLRASRYDATEIASVATDLNRTALSIFQLILTEEYLAQLDPVEIDDAREEGVK